MGFLDKLLGRSKDVKEPTQDAVQDAHVDSEDQPSDVGQAEQRLDDVRDDAFKTEGRMP